MKVDTGNIPSALKHVKTFLLWKYFTRTHGQKYKSPVSTQGYKSAYHDPKILMSLQSAKDGISKSHDLGLGISLLEGLELSVNGQEGYLWCLDFDGFADLNSQKVDHGIKEFISIYPSYVEMSPSGTGFKYFFVTDRPPSKKYKIQFGPSSFAEVYPDIKKYSNREIEVFSCNGFLTLTGDLFDDTTTAISFFASAHFDQMLDAAHDWAISTGGTGISVDKKPSLPMTPTASNTLYSKLTPASLAVVLAHVDHINELTWTETCNALSRVYGEEGRPYFQSYSAGEYAAVTYADYDADECNERFDRALTELENRPDGLGIRSLVDKAKSHSRWPDATLEYVDVNPFLKLEVHTSEFECEPNGCTLAELEEAFASDADQGFLEQMRGFSVLGDGKKLKQKMLDDVFVMKDLAILGQWTSIFAAPNAGKTLFTIWMLREQILSGIIAPENVFYVNADDNFRGMVHKIEIAEKFGMHMLVPGQRGFKVDSIEGLMRHASNSDDAMGSVIILDTLKKFTDLMDKRASAGFGNVAREFTASGGTLITLAHTNKHKNNEGKSVYSGTSDIVDDSDCSYIADEESRTGDALKQTTVVQFNRKKSRGDVADTIGFSFDRVIGQSYEQLMDSVKRIDSDGIKKMKQQSAILMGLRQDEQIIDAVSEVIQHGVNTKAAIIKSVNKSIGESHGSIRQVLDARTGALYVDGSRWTVATGARNAKIYTLLPIPSE